MLLFAMKINRTLLTTLILGIVIGGVILACLLKGWQQMQAKIERPAPQIPRGPVGFAMLPACLLP
jgi:hypothetical protein